MMAGTVAIDGFSDFYRVEFPRVVRTVRPIVGDLCGDIAQDAFMAALVRWNEVVGLDSPAAWVM